MSTQSKTKLLTGAMALAMLLAACGSPAPAAPTSAPAAPAATDAPKPTDAPAPTEAPAAMEAQDIVTWYQYDQKNEDTKADEAVGIIVLPAGGGGIEGRWRGPLASTLGFRCRRRGRTHRRSTRSCRSRSPGTS